MITPPTETLMKKCWICKKKKFKKEFHKDRGEFDGLSARCKECEKNYRKEARLLYIRKYNLLRSEKSREEQKRIRDEIFRILGNKCVKCGFSDSRALQIDHINGDGYKERRMIKKRRNPYILEQLKVGNTNYQVLCCNCNWIKRHENKEYRHV